MRKMVDANDKDGEAGHWLRCMQFHKRIGQWDHKAWMDDNNNVEVVADTEKDVFFIGPTLAFKAMNNEDDNPTNNNNVLLSDRHKELICLGIGFWIAFGVRNGNLSGATIVDTPDTSAKFGGNRETFFPKNK